MSFQEVQLHFPVDPIINSEQLQSKIETYLGAVELAQGDSSWSVIHPGGRTIVSRVGNPAVSEREELIQQSWSCSDPAERLEGCSYALLVMESPDPDLSALKRIEFFHGVLRAVTELTAPSALVFCHAQQVVDPQDYLQACDEPPMLRPGPLNVRFFDLADSPGEMLMDTRGLHELGLPDVQCHFRELDPERVHQVIFNTACYLYENGPVIEPGQSVPGIKRGTTWACRYEDSRMGPSRMVLVLDPGKR
ncbi:MAG: DUF4261 domain-containing protein [Vulcanimicrobiota bacterium]